MKLRKVQNMEKVYSAYFVILCLEPMRRVWTPAKTSMETALQRVLAPLNANQRAAVTAPANGTLQIVAGPGTGKTKVLVSRVAYLLLKEQIEPQHMIVTTFTKKAANEMVERLEALLQDTGIPLRKLLIGTFHSICFRIVQRYGSLIGISGYTIADESDSRDIIKDVLLNQMSPEDVALLEAMSEEELAPFQGKTNEKYRGLDPKKIASSLSRLKSSPLPEEKARDSPLLQRLLVLYQHNLTKNRLLDFDDCLLRCHQLLLLHPSVLSFIQHTLVDEFQDTNDIQLQLMYRFAHSNNVSVVGDPDQSIYAFRDAQVANFVKMRDHYTSIHVPPRIVSLTENYRSTLDILAISELLMRQQSSRVVKELRSQHLLSIKPVHALLETPHLEAQWVASHIKLLLAFPGLYELSDIAILVRSSFQTRILEKSLVQNRIPYHVLKGKAFWERKEVVAMVDYIRCVANENDRLALLRCLNFPKKGLGDKSIAQIESVVEQQLLLPHSKSVFAILKDVASGRVSSSLKPNSKALLAQFCAALDETRLLLPSDITKEERLDNTLGSFFECLFEKSGLAKEFPETDDMSRRLNIHEVKNQLLEYELPEMDPLFEDTEEENDPSGQNFLLHFVASLRLFDTNPQTKEEQEAAASKVVISTIHGAKGLEWPVVLVPGICEGLLPSNYALQSKKADPVDEERRCFYVALTRAKNVLVLSLYNKSDSFLGAGGKSRFLKKLDSLIQPLFPLLLASDLYKLTGKSDSEPPSLREIHHKYQEALEECFEGKRPDPPPEALLGFSTAKLFSIENAKKKPKTSAFKPPKLLAPVYVPNRSGPQSMPKGKSAPAYIPQRSSTKKRLGTRRV